jgi:RNA polymerase sigma factor (TIGR02999 family)
MDATAAPPEQIAELMDRLRNGSKDAAGQLVALFYPELRRLARSHMRGERVEHTWQPTVLVNQLYLELLKIKALRKDESGEVDDRKAFFGLAAHLMRRLLIHHARPLEKQAQRVEEVDFPQDSGADDLAVVENLLSGLERVDPQFRAIVEMKALEGLSMEEIAEQLDIPLRTAYRRWTFARTWLARHLNSDS